MGGAGETDLGRLLASARPEVRPGEYVFVTVDHPVDAEPLASIVEQEGLSLLLRRADADRLGLGYDYVAAWITLTVHSALAAVGLTAAVSAVLAEERISCNVVAGFHHDHLLVPADRVDDAVAAVRRLSRRT